MKDRNAVKNIIKIDKSKLKNVKRVLILDDVTTSLSTLKTIIGLLPTNIAIKALVLASNCRFEGNENV
jgi:predicted amidophosphoribosyltransferase